MEARKQRNLDRYGTPPIPWERVCDTLATDITQARWPAQVAGDALTAEYSAPSAGPPPWHSYRITPTAVFAFGTAEPYGATRFDLTR